MAEELETGADFHFVVHNAAGMVSVQEQVSVTEALIRLRAFAFSSDRLLAEVAGDVVARGSGWDEPRSPGPLGPGAGPLLGWMPRPWLATAGCDGPPGAQEGELR